jgi:hypothetical protein
MPCASYDPRFRSHGKSVEGREASQEPVVCHAVHQLRRAFFPGRLLVLALASLALGDEEKLPGATDVQDNILVIWTHLSLTFSSLKYIFPLDGSRNISPAAPEAGLAGPAALLRRGVAGTAAPT